MNHQENVKAIYEELDAFATLKVQALNLVADDDERRKALYWEARAHGLPFPPEYRPDIGAMLDRMLALGNLDYNVLSDFLEGPKRDFQKRVADALQIIHEVEQEAKVAQARLTGRNRHVRRAAKHRRAGR